MTDIDNLIARLRDVDVDSAYLSARIIISCREAAAALEALRDEVARKDAALRFYATGYYIGDSDGNGYVMPQDLRGTGDTGEIARAALKHQ